MTKYDDIRALFESRNQLDRFENSIKESCGVIMRQTDYDEETAMAKLIEYDLNVMAVVKEYLGVVDKIQIDNRTTNQKVFGEFRKFLDDASTKFYQQRELEQIKQQIKQEYLKRIMETNPKLRNQKLETRNNTTMETIQECINDTSDRSTSSSSDNE